MPLRDVALVRTEGDLRVDRRRAPDAARGEEGDELTVLERREAERPEEVVGGLRLEAREVVGAEVRSALDEQDVAARCASSPAITPPPAPEPTTTTSYAFLTRSPATTSPSLGASPAAS